MKNNRLTNTELFEIKKALKAIRKLEKMESCGFRNNESVTIENL